MQFAVMVMSITVMMQAVVLHFQIKELRELVFSFKNSFS